MKLPACPLCSSQMAEYDDIKPGLVCTREQCGFDHFADVVRELAEQVAKARAWDRLFRLADQYTMMRLLADERRKAGLE